MNRAIAWLVIAGCLTGVAVAQAQFGASAYRLGGVTYNIPQKYEFMRGAGPSAGRPAAGGFDTEPDESVWFRFPAAELARDIDGYSEHFRGYSSQVGADVVVNVVGGREAREFATDRVNNIAGVSRLVRAGAVREADGGSGWTRVYTLRGEPGTPGEGGSIFHLIPREGIQSLPSGWLTPSCLGTQDIDRREIVDCNFTVNSGELTFQFGLRQENLRVARRVHDYVLARLRTWRG